MRFVVWAAELEHEVGDELAQQEVGEDASLSKTVDSHSCLPESHVEVAIDVAIVNNFLHRVNDRVYVEEDHMDCHHPVALLDLLVGVEQTA